MYLSCTQHNKCIVYDTSNKIVINVKIAATISALDKALNDGGFALTHTYAECCQPKKGVPFAGRAAEAGTGQAGRQSGGFPAGAAE